jgi:ketosteroid isomerase-like protein
MTKAEKNKVELVKAFQQCMGEGDRESAFALIDDNAVWHSDEIGAPWSGIHNGIEQVKLHFNNISGTTKNFQRNIGDMIEAGDRVIELGSLSCTLNKTNKLFVTEYVCLYTVINAKITSYRIFEDSLKLYRAYFGNET